MSSQTLKLVVVGDYRTGKSCLVQRLVKSESTSSEFKSLQRTDIWVFADVFTEQHKATIGADFVRHVMNIDNEEVTLQIWDVSAQLKGRDTVTRNVFKDSNGVIITFTSSGTNVFYSHQLWGMTHYKDVTKSVAFTRL